MAGSPIQQNSSNLPQLRKMTLLCRVSKEEKDSGRHKMSKKGVRDPKLLTEHPHCLQGLHVQSSVSDTGLARGVCAMHTVSLPAASGTVERF